jgi:Fe-S cluster assembly protein SufD
MAKMDLQEKLVSSFMVLENLGELDLDSNVHAIRTEAISAFEKFPY